MTEERREKEAYEKKTAQAISQIPVYTDEWTNHLPSDPGITILENLTAFSLLLLEKQRKIPEEIRLLLPGLAGITPQEGAGARLLLGSLSIQDFVTIPKYQRFYLGDLCFETKDRLTLAPGRLKKVYRGRKGYPEKAEELGELRPGNPLAAPVFGNLPERGDTVYLVFDGPFAKAREEVLLYVSAQETFPRNRPDRDFPVNFADAGWSYCTAEGYVSAECTDATGGFLKSGEIRIRLGDDPPAAGRVGMEEGYIIRCTLLSPFFDQTPCVRVIEGPLFEVYERESRAVSYDISCGDADALLDDIYASGFSEEESCFSMYTGNNREGFFKAPESETAGDRIKLLRMDREMAVQAHLGTLYGYDNQELELALQGEILEDSLEIMAEKGQGTRQRFYFFRPGEKDDHAVHYIYDPERRAVRILDAGDFEGCPVSVSGCAVYHGKEGNVLAGNTFLRRSGQTGEVYYNPADGQGGKDRERLTELIGRLREEVSRPEALVTEADYEKTVLNTPDLCIHKVHALRGEENGEIQIYVKPYREEELPGLSDQYRHQIRAWLERFRLLGDRLHIMGPEYVRVDVSISAQVRLEYTDAEEIIERTVRKELDHVNGDHDFGGCVSGHQLMKTLEKLPCVEYIRELALTPQEVHGIAEDSGSQIRFEENVLCYAGRIEILVKRSSIL